MEKSGKDILQSFSFCVPQMKKNNFSMTQSK